MLASFPRKTQLPEFEEDQSMKSLFCECSLWEVVLMGMLCAKNWSSYENKNFALLNQSMEIDSLNSNLRCLHMH